MADLTETRRANLNYRRACEDRVTKSRLPAGLKDTLRFILSYINSASNYTAAWVSAETIARTTGHETRSIERHIHILQKVGLIHRQKISIEDARTLLKEKFDYTLRTNNPNTWFISLTTISRDHSFWQGEPHDELLDQIRAVAHVARVGGKKAAQDAERTVTSDTNIPSPGGGNIPSPEGRNIPSPETEKHREEEKDEPTQETASPEQTPAAPPEQSDTKSVRRGSHQQEPPSDAEDGGFDWNEEECDSPRLAAVEGVAGSHPLHGPSDPVASTTPRRSEDPLPADEEEVSSVWEAEEDTTLEELDDEESTKPLGFDASAALDESLALMFSHMEDDE
jgi:hypothetical protein